MGGGERRCGVGEWESVAMASSNSTVTVTEEKPAEKPPTGEATTHVLRLKVLPCLRLGAAVIR